VAPAFPATLLSSRTSMEYPPPLGAWSILFDAIVAVNCVELTRVVEMLVVVPFFVHKSVIGVFRKFEPLIVKVNDWPSIG